MKTRLHAFLAEKNDLVMHDTLNPVIWENDRLKPELKSAMLRIADTFIEFLGADKTHLNDIVFTGSNVGYMYHDKSDIDLHFIFDFDAECKTCGGIPLEDCMLAKKSLWNDEHDIGIKGYQVEVYAEMAEKLVTSAGVYSILHDTWVQHPTRDPIDVNDPLIIQKAKELRAMVDAAVDGKVDELDSLDEISARIRDMRAAGLSSAGEYSIENLAFKVLRNDGTIEKLKNYKRGLEDSKLSLD